MKRNDGMAFDVATKRHKDENGFLHVAMSHISKETINPYYGREIPNWEELGLDPEKIYQGYRMGDELAKGADTFNGLPILMGHHAESADNPQKEHRIGSMGTDAAFEAPYLNNSLIITDAEAIQAIEDGRTIELSSAYRYEPIFKKGMFDRKPYDFVMTNIRGNHVALVEEGRAGPDVVVADQQIKPNPIRRFGMGIKELIEKMRAFIAGAEKEGAQIDPDSLAKGKELISDMAAVLGEEGKAQDDELDTLGAEIYALIDTMEDHELADKIKAKIEEARMAGEGAGDCGDPIKALDEVPPDVAEKMKAAGLDPMNEGEAKAFMAGLMFMDKEKMEKIETAGDEDPQAEAENAEKPWAKEKDLLTAQDAAIIRTRAKAEARTETMAHIRALNQAAQAVRPLCGELDIFAFDSAAAIYRHALASTGRKSATTDVNALREMVGMAMDAKANSAMAMNMLPKHDSTKMTGAFSGLKKIQLG